MTDPMQRLEGLVRGLLGLGAAAEPAATGDLVHEYDALLELRRREYAALRRGLAGTLYALSKLEARAVEARRRACGRSVATLRPGSFADEGCEELRRRADRGAEQLRELAGRIARLESERLRARALLGWEGDVGAGVSIATEPSATERALTDRLERLEAEHAVEAELVYPILR